MTGTPTFSVLAEIEWDFADGEEDINWKFLVEEATFHHKEACEFVLHAGTDPSNEYHNTYNFFMVEKMKKFGCTQDFIEAYEGAVRMGAVRVMFWS